MQGMSRNLRLTHGTVDDMLTCRPETRTYHGRVESGSAQRGGWARRAWPNGMPTGFSVQDTTVTRVHQGIENDCPEHIFGSMNQRNPTSTECGNETRG